MGSEKSVGPQKLLVPTKFRFQKKILGPQESFGVWIFFRILDPRNFFCPKIILGLKKFWALNTFGSEKYFGSTKIFGSGNILDLKKIWIRKIFGPEKDFESEKKLWVQIFFWALVSRSQIYQVVLSKVSNTNLFHLELPYSSVTLGH